MFAHAPGRQHRKAIHFAETSVADSVGSGGDKGERESPACAKAKDSATPPRRFKCHWEKVYPLFGLQHFSLSLRKKLAKLAN